MPTSWKYQSSHEDFKLLVSAISFHTFFLNIKLLSQPLVLVDLPSLDEDVDPEVVKFVEVFRGNSSRKECIESTSINETLRIW
jgi:hypothetical protein